MEENLNELKIIEEPKPSKCLGLLIPGWIIFGISALAQCFLYYTILTSEGIGLALMFILIGAPLLYISDGLFLISSILFFIAFGKSLHEKKLFGVSNKKIVPSLIFAIISLVLIVASYFLIKLFIAV